MKNLILVFTFCAASLSSYAYQDGEYTCGNRDKFFEITYKITTLNLNGSSLPMLNITKKYYKNPAEPNSVEKTYHIDGMATVYSDESGQETLTLGNIAVDVSNGGRPSCIK